MLVQLHGHPLLQPRGEMDSGVYLDLARRVAGGDLLAGDRTFFMSPFYIYFVAAILVLSGSSVLAVQLVQVLLGTLAVWLVMLTSREWFGERAALVAGVLAALTGYLAFNEILILQSAVDPFLTALGLWLLARAWLHGGWRPWLAAGVVLGLHGLNRPNVLLWAAAAPVLALLVPVTTRSAQRPAGNGRQPAGRPRDSLLVTRYSPMPAAMLALGVVLALSPVALRNYAVAHQLALVSSHGGLNFYIGNNPEADGTYHTVAGITPSIAGQDRDMRRVVEKASGRPVTDEEASSWFYERAWAWIVQHPGQAAKLFARKLAYVFNAIDLPLNFSYAYYSSDEDTLLRWLFVGPWLLLPLGLAGLWLARAGLASGRAEALPHRTAAWWCWVAFVPVYAVSVAVFFVAGRYRLPLLPALCVTGAGALLRLWERWQSGSRLRMAGGVAVVVLVGVFANWNFGLDNGLSAERTEMILHDVDTRQDAAAAALLARTEPEHPERAMLLSRVGQAYLERGDAGRALPLLERARGLAPDCPEIHLALGEALVDSGRAADAVPHLRAALQARVRPDLAAFDLARALAATGAREDALASLRALPSADHLDGASQVAVGRLALDLGDAGLAQTFLERAVQAAPGDAAARGSLGLALGLLGRRAEAIDALAAACRLDPGNAMTHLNLAVAYADEGRDVQARQQAEEALRLRPGYAQARALLAALDRARK